MAAITSAGVGSGIDIEGLITKLVAAEGQPATKRLDTKEAGLQADLSALGSVKGALSSFQTSLQGLKNASAFQARTATSSNTDLFTVSANSSAVAGSFSVTVDQLAQAAKVRSIDFTSDTEVVGAGSLAIGLGAANFTIDVAADTTLAGIRDAINQASDNPGIKATIITVDSGSQLVLTSDKVGADNAITIAATDADALDGKDLTRLATANLISVQSAQDAIIHVDGQQVTRSSNSLSDVIPGVTLSLVKADASKTESLSVDLDKSSVKSKIDDFIKAYNALAETLGSLSKYDAATKTGGPLLGDATLRGIQNQIRQALSNPVQGAADFSSLSEIGVTSSKTGALELDAAKLDKALSSNFDSISKLFSGENGLASRFDSVINNYLSAEGALSSRLDGVNKQISNISDQRDRLNTRLTAIESRYRKQFTAMDALVAQLQSTGSFLTQQLSNLPGASSSKS
ncbi:Flagellar hook-associated protein 2 [Candidatus Methylobacter favarea]|uniref:Flagellar hook-associated protein 2 n=1 Tax=Candidatus Methylobacter favarea TaxID=2707345 RepID=A0A8S0XKV4_9GAMM|nr:flagellar filament capping protein FliD [Candidatus Methylobacter favarea]CAA9892322.1 Flagellar hook-associated protein 2 [Candidatus Methylobacter favarea]